MNIGIIDSLKNKMILNFLVVAWLSISSLTTVWAGGSTSDSPQQLSEQSSTTSPTRSHSTYDSLGSLGLPDSHIDALLEACFDMEFECRFLVREINGKPQIVTLVGEMHSQKERSFFAGR